ncbi:MAG: Mrp/NBP35 family ATP-binding protein [Nitrososphaerota archaeon]|nr:Mrp/NBP35 family ATP-binding protein [Nitrososphaerota archaeon]
MVSEAEVLSALKSVIDPELKIDVVSMGMIKDLDVSGGRVRFTLELTTPACPYNSQIEQQVRSTVESLPGVRSVEIRVTARVLSSKRASITDTQVPLPGVKNVVAVASGKGGVGKSTVAVNLAVAWAEAGASVGLLDADIYGPTIPRFIPITTMPSMSGKKLIPALTDFDVRVMSLGLLVQGDVPLIWRGPLVGGAVKQMLAEVEWGDLDYLVVDLPPGTGDASLTLAQMTPISGVVIVTTPQDAATKIAAKSLRMFMQLNVRILGLIENMSYYVCSHCGNRSDIFGADGARRLAEEYGVPLLGQIPLDPMIRESADAGTPLIKVHPDSQTAQSIRAIARQLAGRLSVLAVGKHG